MCQRNCCKKQIEFINIEQKLIAQCKELINSLKEYNKDYDEDNENNEEPTYLHEWADGITSSLQEFSFCLNEREKIKLYD